MRSNGIPLCISVILALAFTVTTAEPRFIAVDPKSAKVGSSQSWNRYTYVLDNPVSMIDPDGRDALSMTFVGYMVTTNSGKRRRTGHSGITTVRKNGYTKYSEFGRYGSPSGKVRYRGPFPNLVMGTNGVPTKASLKRYMQAVTAAAGQNKPVQGAYFINDTAQTMENFVNEREADPSKQGDYNTVGNNCATYTEDVLEAGGEDLDVSLINTPDNVIQEEQDVADFAVSYNPQDDTLTVTCSGDACPE